jgi:hypothetical protein
MYSVASFDVGHRRYTPVMLSTELTDVAVACSAVVAPWLRRIAMVSQRPSYRTRCAW